ncbi:MAG: hypothetical protein WKG07_28600 [Hymenobacter sp.]
MDTVALKARRLAFQQGVPAPRFVKVEVSGLRPDQNEYARSFFRERGRSPIPSTGWRTATTAWPRTAISATFTRACATMPT